ncbi:three-Cys-motif partner protein TcmP [Caulobacter vibrioides]|uniref:three-Cys-motif partner protein TcmP n=1 Tax=Caulobacter vibrioides TaxID=155892 RepID=UPI0013DDB8BD|nr:three-Cys-motif partner protein TcmP [Caulobacter vibrioides]
MIGELKHYQGREQAYVKHFLLSEYLESWAHKVASTWEEVAYVDGFSGPWQHTGEAFEDTSFGIALRALTRAKASWKGHGKTVKMSAFLVEKDPGAYANLQAAKTLFPDVEIKTYPGSFIDQAPKILRDIPPRAFAFFFIDPKGWGIDMKRIAPLLRRPHSEVVFNFMFDFINRAASIQNSGVAASLDELILDPTWRARLEARPLHVTEADHRKTVLVDAFSRTLAQLGQYTHVAETTVLRPLKDRPLYSLVYGTRNSKGIEVFRSSQIKALGQQDRIRGLTKLSATAAASDQTEMFGSLSEMAPDPSVAFLAEEERRAGQLLQDLVPAAPGSVRWPDLWPRIMERHVVTKTQVKQIANDLRRGGILTVLDWGPKQRTVDDHNRIQRS